MNAISAIIANGDKVNEKLIYFYCVSVNCCNLQRGSRNKLISHLLYKFIINPLMAASSNPFQRGSQGWGVFIDGNHAARRGNGSSWWECLCDVCFASKKSSEWEIFIPAGMHLGVKLLTA